jgi:hypothetical protein
MLLAFVALYLGGVALVMTGFALVALETDAH